MATQVDFSRGRNDQKDFDNLQALTGDASIKGIIGATATVDPADLADGAGATISVTVTGAALGDIVLVGAPYDLVDFTVSAYVQADDTVEIRVQNESGSSANLASGTWNIIVFDMT